MKWVKNLLLFWVTRLNIKEFFIAGICGIEAGSKAP